MDSGDTAGARGFGMRRRRTTGTAPPRLWPDDEDPLPAMHGERIGTLVRLIRYLEENGVMDGTPETFGARHATQKYAYLAGEMGAPVEYRFDFLENGAYSAALATDLYMLERAEGGVPPFGAGDAAGEAFVRLVLGRGRLTLQAMTFAMRDMRAGMGRDEFVRTMARDYSRYSRRLLGWAFDSVLAAAGGPGGGRMRNPEASSSASRARGDGRSAVPGRRGRNR